MPHEQSVTDANQLLDGLHDSLQAGNDDLARRFIENSFVESSWLARYFFSSGNHTNYRLLCIISEKDSITGLEAILQSSSRILKVTGLKILENEFSKTSFF